MLLFAGCRVTITARVYDGRQGYYGFFEASSDGTVMKQYHPIRLVQVISNHLQLPVSFTEIINTRIGRQTGNTMLHEYRRCKSGL